VGRACGTYGRREKHVQGSDGKRLKEKDHLKDQGVDGRMVSKWTFGRLVGGGVEWIHLVQDRDCWWASLNAVMKLQVLAPWS
jgi:hypothetical protein